MPDVDVIGGFAVVSDNCAGCGKPLVIENAWMADGCPCNSPLGVNSMNETRWRLLMTLQQQQARVLDRLPKTADGVTIVPGMRLYPMHPLAPIDLDGAEDYAVAQMIAEDPVSGDEVGPDELSMNYSSAEAATRARENKQV